MIRGPEDREDRSVWWTRHLLRVPIRPWNFITAPDDGSTRWSDPVFFFPSEALAFSMVYKTSPMMPLREDCPLSIALYDYYIAPITTLATFLQDTPRYPRYPYPYPYPRLYPKASVEVKQRSLRSSLSIIFPPFDQHESESTAHACSLLCSRAHAPW